jgi:hypothetical protein
MVKRGVPLGVSEICVNNRQAREAIAILARGTHRCAQDPRRKAYELVMRTLRDCGNSSW